MISMRTTSPRLAHIATAVGPEELPLDAFPDVSVRPFVGLAELPSDLSLLVLDGDALPLETIEAIAADPRITDVPRLVVGRAPAAAIDDWISRPVSAPREELVRRLRLLLELGATRAELRLRKLEQQAFDHAVLDAVDLGIVTTDAIGRVSYSNRAARELLARSSLEGVDIRSALGAESSGLQLLGSSSHTILERDIEVRTSEYEGEYVVLLRDATEERKMQHEMRRVERLAAMGTMVSGFAHEVRNPVASLRTMTESLAEDLAEMNIHLPHVKRMLSVLARIERLVSTSLQFGRPASPRRVSVRPWTIVAAALGTIAARTRELGGEIRVDIEPDLPSVFVDEGQLVQVMVILLNNALDAAVLPAKVTVRVAQTPIASERGKTRPPPTAIRFQVEDEGPGVAADVEQRMFDPFFTTKAQGTGLGLSIAQQIVSENAGRLALESAREPTIFVVDCSIDNRSPR
jgi:nitrogen-specific signal transduction histidine kinase